MDYSAVIEAIRAERLELVEFLEENRQQLVDTLIYVANTSSLMLQNVTGVLEVYYHLQQDVYLMMNDLDTLEQELMQWLRWKSQKTALLRATKYKEKSQPTIFLIEIKKSLKKIKIPSINLVYSTKQVYLCRIIPFNWK